MSLGPPDLAHSARKYRPEFFHGGEHPARHDIEKLLGFHLNRCRSR